MYYPDQRYAAQLTIIRRECLLPEEAIGNIRISEGKRVDVRDVVANGMIPNRHIIIDGLAFFGLRKPEELIPLMKVEVGDVVDERDLLAGKNPKRGKRLFSPAKSIVSKIDKGRIILHAMPEIIDLEAGVRGRISSILPGRGVVIEAVGGQVQGVWGNNRRTIATLRVAPEETLESAVSDDLDLRFSGAVVVTSRPLTENGIRVMADRNFVGIIAPSMDNSLRDMALGARGAILLTEGFGNIRMGRTIYSILTGYDGQQVTLDAYMPNRYELRFPEIIINVATKGDEKPVRPNAMLSLRAGMTVRITRDPYMGHTGRVVDLPKSAVLIDNGLRVNCARVELLTGENTFVPLANLEVLGR